MDSSLYPASRVPEADVGEDPVQPARESPRVPPEDAQEGREQDERTSIASSSAETPRITPISLGGSGPESAKVKKTATITAAAAKMTRPE
jgi:hypothetical protein